MHLFLTSSNLTLNGQYMNEENGFRSLLLMFFLVIFVVSILHLIQLIRFIMMNGETTKESLDE